MKRLIIIILLFLININFLWAENIDIEVYMADDNKGDVNLIVDRKELGTIPLVIKNIGTGNHYFTIKWVDESGKTCTKFENIKITSKDKCLYLSTIKVKSKEWVPFFCGFCGGALVFWLIFSH